MSVNLSLSADEASFLRLQLERRMQNLARELVGTSRRELQHQLAADEVSLREILQRLRHAAAGEPVLSR